ncbi:MAG TPA: hypothetical protein ENK70_05715 [Methylophaga sp.]|nr:hypothetical protein [Methylophaga sp.]
MPRRLELIELREKAQRRSVRAVFRYTDKVGETSRTLIWQPSEDRYYLDMVQDTDKASIIKIMDYWKPMLRPDDFELMKQHLGIITEARGAVEETLAQ